MIGKTEESLNQEDGTGHVVYGVPIGAHQFLAAIPGAVLVGITPRKLAVSSLEEGAVSSESVNEIAEHADYLRKAAAGELPAVIPPIVLWTNRTLKTVGGAPGHALVLPFDLIVLVLDGAAQVAAWHTATQTDPKVRALLIPVVMHHGRSREWVRQAAQGLHTAGLGWAGALALDTYQRDPMTRVALYVEERVPLLKGRVSRRRQLSASANDLMTLSALRTACATFAFGLPKLQAGFRAIQSAEISDDTQVRQIAALWFDAVLQAFSDEFKPCRRSSSVMPTPAAMAAIGAFGHGLLYTADINADIARKLERLHKIDWSRGVHWNGIAGKMSPKGSFSTAGGTKENAYPIYRALAEPSSKEYVLTQREPQL
jgi:DNA sulfur modification protein DndB